MSALRQPLWFLKIKRLALFAALAGIMMIGGQTANAQGAATQEKIDNRLRGLSLNAALRYYPVVEQPFKASLPGLRLGADYALPWGAGSLLLGAEAGAVFSLAGPTKENYWVEGDALWLFPVAAKVSYLIPIKNTKFYAGGAALAGGALSLLHGAAGFDPLAGARLAVEYRLNERILIFADGGVDALFEQAGSFVMPVLEVGVRFVIGGKGKAGGREEIQEDIPEEIPEDLRLTVLHFLGDLANMFAETEASRELAALSRIAEYLRSHPGVRVIVSGHCAMSGTAGGRLTLSRERAGNVAHWLTQHGVAAERIEERFFGGERPIANNNTWAGRQRNRRVELELVGE